MQGWICQHVAKARRYSIANHLVLRLDIRSLEDEVVGECLDAGTFADAEAAVRWEFVLLERPFLVTEVEHLGRRGMQRVGRRSVLIVRQLGFV